MRWLGYGMKITKSQLLKLIRENMDGHPWSGTLEDLATAHGKTWGGGAVVDPKGYKGMVKTGVAFTKGKAPSPLDRAKKKINETSGNTMKINKSMLKRLLEEIESELVQIEVPLEQPPIEHDEAEKIPGVEAKEDVWAGGDNLDDPVQGEVTVTGEPKEGDILRALSDSFTVFD